MIQKSREIFGAEDLLTMLDSKATLTLALTTETFKKCIQRLNHGGSRHGFVSWCILKSRDFMIPQFKKKV